MLFLIQICVVILGLLMFIVPIRYKVSILVFSFICLDAIVVNFIPFGKSELLLSNCFIVSELPSLYKRIREIRYSFIYKLLIMMIAATVILAMFSPHYRDVYNIARLSILELFGKYFAIAYGFICIKKEQDFCLILKVIGCGLILLTLFGIENYVTKQSWWFHMAYSGGTKDVDILGFEMSDRFRVQSMFVNPFCYGYICVIISIIYLYAYCKKIINKSRFLLITICSLYGIIFCGCRTIMIIYVLCCISFVFYILSKKQKRRFAILLILIITIMIPLFPTILASEVIDSYVHIFDIDVSESGSNGYGSSIGMRLLQISAVFYYLSGYWFFGRGLDFFNIDMGWGEDGKNTLIDQDLWGLEGVYLNLLLERGIFGFLCWIIFYGSLFLFFYKRINIMRFEAVCGMSILLAYLLFANMTGELNSVFPTLLIAGMIIKIIHIKDTSSIIKGKKERSIGN